MKNNKTLLILFILLAGISIFFIYRTKYSTVKDELKNFSVSDTASITKIFLADKAGKSLTLSRGNDKVWVLNDKYSPRRSNVLNLLEVIYKVDVRTKVAKAAYNTVLKSLASNGIKCEIYLNGKDEPERVFYVGGQTEDAMGTFMMIENSNAPFITHIPGFNGYLTPRFSTDEMSWRDPALFTYQPDKIKSIKLEYRNFPQNSFLIEQTAGSKKVFSSDGSNPLSNADTIGIDNYLNLYSTVYFESIVTTLDKNAVDSMLSLPPAILLTISDADSGSKRLSIYPMPLSKTSLAQTDSLGKPLQFDVDRVYGYLQPDELVILIQQQNINKLFRRKIDFDLNKSNSPVVKKQ